MKEIIQREAQKALDCQDACNLKAIIPSMNQARDLILELGGRDKGTDWFNSHPIMQMYASKIHSLCGMGLSDVDAFSKAYDLCQRMARGEDCY